MSADLSNYNLVRGILKWQIDGLLFIESFTKLSKDACFNFSSGLQFKGTSMNQNETKMASLK